MSASFLTTAQDELNLQVAVEVAWGADLTDLDGSGWTWDDITDYVIMEHGGGAGGGVGTGGGLAGDAAGGSISINLGRPDFSSETQTANMVCELDNRDGRFSEGGLSPYWPNIRRGTPVRVQVSPDGGDTWYLRFQGQSDGFSPNWPEKTGRWATVTLSASGPLRKLNQGTLPAKSVYATEIPRSTSWPSMFMYWPCENGDGVRNNPPLIPADGKPPLVLDVDYRPKVANNPSNAAFPMSGPLQSQFKMFCGNGWFGGVGPASQQIPSYTNTGILQVRFMFAIPGQIPTHTDTTTITEDGGSNTTDVVREFPGINWQPLFHMHTTNSTVPIWSLQMNDLGWLRVVGMDSDQVIIRSNDEFAWGLSGEAWFGSVIFSNSGSSLTALVRTKKMSDLSNLSATWTFSNSNIGVLDGLDMVGPDCSPDGTGTDNVLIAHVSVHNSNQQINTTGVNDLLSGMPGETVMERLTRLCDRHNIYVEALTSTTGANASIVDTMGPQYYDTLTNLLRETERTGQGLLYDGLGPGLTYVTKGRRQDNANGPAALVIDAASAQLMEPFAPVDDDQLTINHCDSNARNGAVATYLDTDGPAGGNVIGDYATSIEVNPETDANVIRYAQWLVGIGTQQGYRYPTVSFALETNPGLVADWLACTPQSRIDVENVATVRRQHAPEPIKMLLEGWHEEIDAFTWRVTANTSPAAPWNVIKAAAATGSTGDGVCHLDTDSSQLAAAASAGATSISVQTNSGPRWVTAADTAEGGSDNFPFDLDVGGCKVTVSAVSGTTSPQTFTVSTLPRAFALGTPVKVWRPPVLGL